MSHTNADQRWITERLAVDKANRLSLYEHIVALQKIRAYLMDGEHLDDWGVPVIYLRQVDAFIAEACGYEVPA